MESLHAMLQVLQKQRRQVGRDLAHRRTGVAACETLDRLIARVKVFTDRFPANTPMTLSFIENDMDEALALLRMCADVTERLANLMTEAEDVVYQRRQPLIAFMSRVEFEGYRVDTETGTTVIDARDWSMLDTLDDPDQRVLAAAEQITREEQAGIYQERLQRMHAAVDRIEAGYADRIRELGISGF